MKTVSGRDALFLNEMGIGPLWQLCAVATPVADAVGEDAVDVAAAVPQPDAVSERGGVDQALPRPAGGGGCADAGSALARGAFRQT